METILEKIASEFQIAPKAILGKSRKREIADARFILYFYYRHQNLSYPQIAKIVGKKDHATILNGCQQVEWIPQLKNIANKILNKQSCY